MDQKKQAVKSSVLKAGKRTFFFDIFLASNNKKYLKITESTFVDEAGNRKRNRMILFPEDVNNFLSKLTELNGELN